MGCGASKRISELEVEVDRCKGNITQLLAHQNAHEQREEAASAATQRELARTEEITRRLAVISTALMQLLPEVPDDEDEDEA